MHVQVAAVRNILNKHPDHHNHGNKHIATIL